MRTDGHLVVAFPAGSHAMIEALVLAASPVLELEEFSFRPARRTRYDRIWRAARRLSRRMEKAAHRRAQLSGAEIAPEIHAGALQAATAILDACGEPLAYSWLHHSALKKLAQAGTLARTLNVQLKTGDNAFQFLRHRLEEGFKLGYADAIDHWQDKTRVLWERRVDGRLPSPHPQSLAARVETFVRATLVELGRVSAENLEDIVLAKFTGLQTPEIEWIELCAQAYADLQNGEWVWRGEDSNVWREVARARLAQLAARLDFVVSEDAAPHDQKWRVVKIIPGSSSGTIPETRILDDAYVFRLCANLDLDELIQLRALPLRGFLVLPEPQVALTLERLRRDPRWLKLLQAAGWEFLRVPYIEMLLHETITERPEFQLAWGLEPALGQGKEQMELF